MLCPCNGIIIKYQVFFKVGHQVLIEMMKTEETCGLFNGQGD